MKPYSHNTAGTFRHFSRSLPSMLLLCSLCICLVFPPLACTPERILHPLDEDGPPVSADSDPTGTHSSLLQILYFAWADNGDYQAVLADLDEMYSAARKSLSGFGDLRVAYACGDRTGHEKLPEGLSVFGQGEWKQETFPGWEQAQCPGDALAAALDWCGMAGTEEEQLRVLVVAGESGLPYRGILYDRLEGRYLDAPKFAALLGEKARAVDLVCFDSGFSSSIELSYEIYSAWPEGGRPVPRLLGMSGQFPLEGRDYFRVLELLEAEFAGRDRVPDLSSLASCFADAVDHGSLQPGNSSVLLSPAAWELLLPEINRLCGEVCMRLNSSQLREEYREELMQSSSWYTTPGDLRISPRSLLEGVGESLFIPEGASPDLRLEGTALLESLRSSLDSAMDVLIQNTYAPQAVDPVHMLLVPLFSNGTADPRFPLEYSSEDMGYCPGRLGFCRDSLWAPGSDPSLQDRLWFDLIE